MAVCPLPTLTTTSLASPSQERSVTTSPGPHHTAGMSTTPEVESDGESTAAQVHAAVCSMVTARAASSSAWAEYAAVLLDAETSAFFAARLSDAQAPGPSDGRSSPPSKKRKLRDGSGSDGEAEDAPVPVVCEHCGGAVPQISLRVACMDGTTLAVTVAQRGLVREVKRVAGQVRADHACCKGASVRVSPHQLA